MQRGDGGGREIRQLFPQFFVSLVDGRDHRAHQLLLHLVRRLFGERDGEQLGQPRLSLENEADRAVDHDERLSAPRGSGNQKIAFSVLNRQSLFLFQTHCLPPLLPPRRESPRT